jgi:endonuclease/exonuclease/phosphatase family metal-dependent hydrolase
VALWLHGRRGVIAAALLIPFVVWFEFWLVGWQPGTLGPKLMALTPWVAWLSLVPLVVTLAMRVWPAAILALLIAFVFVTSFLAPRLLSGPRSDVARDGVALRVMSSNLYVGRADPAAVVDMVRSRRIDVLTLVELPPDELERLDRAGLRTLLPYRDVAARTGSDGSGLFSRYPLTRLTPSSKADRGGEPRALVAVPGAVGVDVQVVHPLPPIHGWKQDWHDALQGLPAVDTNDGHAHLLVGDFNATLDHPELRRLLGFIHDGDFEPDNLGYDDAADRAGKGLVMTWPADRRYPPLIAIDHVLVDRRAGVASFGADDVKGSDHRAVVATVRVPRRL